MHEYLIEDKLSSIHLSVEMTQEIQIEETLEEFSKQMSEVTGMNYDIVLEENGQLLLIEKPNNLKLT